MLSEAFIEVDDSGLPVLILVLVEHALGVLWCCSSLATCRRLNPCFSGTCSRRGRPHIKSGLPCVLILVLVEHALGERENLTEMTRYSLNPCFSGTCSRRQEVLRLSTLTRLNPCFSGTCSRRRIISEGCVYAVLILVLVEHALGDLSLLV